MPPARKKHDDGRGEMLTDIYAPARAGQGPPKKLSEYKGRMVTDEELAAAEGIGLSAARNRRHRQSLRKNGNVHCVKRLKAREYLKELKANKPEPLVDASTRYERDDRCWYVTAVHPDGLTLEEVGHLLCVTRERIRQIERKALRKLRALGVRHEDLIRMKHAGAQLAELRERSESRFNPASSGVHYLVPPTAMPNGRRRAS
jgi:hypothetical protein